MRKWTSIMVVFALGILLAACGGRKTADKNQTAVMESLDSLERQAEVEKQLEENQEDIKALWDDEIGEDKAIDKYALAGEYVYLSSEDGKEGMLLTFYLDGRNENNFDGIPIKENERMAFYGKNLIVTINKQDSMQNIYFENTEREGLNPVLVVTEKDGRQFFYDNAGGVISQPEAKKIMSLFNDTTATPLEKVLKGWKKLNFEI